MLDYESAQELKQLAKAKTDEIIVFNKNFIASINGNKYGADDLDKAFIILKKQDPRFESEILSARVIPLYSPYSRVALILVLLKNPKYGFKNEIRKILGVKNKETLLKENEMENLVHKISDYFSTFHYFHADGINIDGKTYSYESVKNAFDYLKQHDDKFKRLVDEIPLLFTCKEDLLAFIKALVDTEKLGFSRTIKNALQRQNTFKGYKVTSPIRALENSMRKMI